MVTRPEQDRRKMTGKILATIALVGSVIALVGCGTKPAPMPEPPVTSTQVVLKISGSGSATAILAALQSAFEADTPGYHVNVLPGSGTSGGVKGVIQGVLDVAAMVRPPQDEEAAQNVAFLQIGQAGQAIITHPDVGIANLTTEQVRAIFTGQATNWSQVGGPNLPIILYVRDESDSSTKALRQTILGETPFPETVAQVFTSQSDMLVAVEGTPSSVGIATWPTALAKGVKVQAVSIDGVAPGDFAYPMVSTLGIGYLEDRRADVQPLGDWLLSEKGQAALREFDVIPLLPSRL
jgi:phosphate transport system substrate-binding protein